MSDPQSTDFRALAEQYWLGQADLANEHHPVRVSFPGGQEIAPGLLFFKGVAAISVVDTGAGLVMLDAGTPRDIDRVYEAVRAWRPDTPLVAAIYSHHHMDHIWATRRFDEEAARRGWARPVVYAQSLLPEHFDRYRKTQAWNNASSYFLYSKWRCTQARRQKPLTQAHPIGLDAPKFGPIPARNQSRWRPDRAAGR